MDLRTNFGGLILEHSLMNAAGTCKLTEQVHKLARSASAAVMVGSITFGPRLVNTGDVFWQNDTFSLNSLGLPNPGKDYYIHKLPEMVKIAHDFGKPIFVSVAGFSPEEYGILVEVAIQGGADAVELNLGCPNIWDGGKQKRIACFDLKLMHEILFEEVSRRVGQNHIIGVKPSPFSDPIYLEEFGCMLKGGFVKFITAVNTFPNAFALDKSGKPRITPAGGLAGLAGSALKPIALGQIKQYRAILPEYVQIAGAGGCRSGQDIMDFKRVGATVVQMNTYYNEDERVFDRILSDYVNLVEETEALANS